jgi:ABC-type sulfate/molybdate transport systems ATPase subunit
MLRLENVDFAFAKAESHTLKDISFHLDGGKHLAVMGESGCGKSTLLNYIYGLLDYQSGTVTYNGVELKGAQDHLVPGHPMMKYVPQEFNLMPYTTVAENVGEHLSIQLDGRDRRIAELLQVVDLAAFSNRKVKTLSGGQKQRVAIAKALAQEPEVLLLDEPFSHIDHFRRNNLRRRIYNYLDEKGIASIVATHDCEDVLPFTDELLVMHDGEILDHRSTDEIYHDPKTRYTASLFDEVTEMDGSLFNKNGTLLLYPHQLKVSDSGLEVMVGNSFFLGTRFLIKATYENGQPIFFSHKHELKAKDVVYLQLNRTTKS